MPPFLFSVLTNMTCTISMSAFTKSYYNGIHMTSLTKNMIMVFEALAKIINSLNPAHYPKKFILMLLIKNDIIFGQCSFRNRQEADEFYAIIVKDTSAEWGRVVADVTND